MYKLLLIGESIKLHNLACGCGLITRGLWNWLWLLWTITAINNRFLIPWGSELAATAYLSLSCLLSSSEWGALSKRLPQETDWLGHSKAVGLGVVSGVHRILSFFHICWVSVNSSANHEASLEAILPSPSCLVPNTPMEEICLLFWILCPCVNYLSGMLPVLPHGN